MEKYDNTFIKILSYKIRLFPELNSHIKNIPSTANNLKSKIDQLNVDKLKTVPDFKMLSDVVDKYVVKKSGYIELKSKVVRLEHITSTSTLIDNGQYNAD